MVISLDYRTKIIKILAKETKLSKEELENLVSRPPSSQMGDYAFPSFKLGKKASEEAEKLKQKIERRKLPGFLRKTEVAGPYLNFYINPRVLAEETLTKIYQEKQHYGWQEVGKSKSGKQKTIVIDFSSPNIAKPFGIGHLRSTVIGNSLSKIYHALGYRVIGVNHLGDWGTQFGKLIVAYHRWGEEKELEKEPIKHLLQLYVQFHQEAVGNPDLEEEARLEFKKLEDGNKESLALWETFKELSMEEFKRIYHILGVEFDSYAGESFYNHLVEKTIQELQRKVPTEMSEGALVVNLEKYRLPPVLLKKSNESTTYHTRDLTALFYRLKHYSPQQILYVVGAEQRLYFQQLFQVAELAGIDKSKLTHVDFGLFRFPEGKMSTREGKVIFLEEVLNKAIELAEKIIEEKNPTLKCKKEVAKLVGVGAIVFGDLSSDRIRDIEFNWERMLSFEGETGPYLQYTHARACSILRKARREYRQGVSPKVNFADFALAEELEVIRKLAEFPEVLVKVAETFKPHHLAGYLITLAQAFNEFYHLCPVISEVESQMKARLLLVDAVRQVLENGLGLLGIKAPEEM